MQPYLPARYITGKFIVLPVMTHDVQGQTVMSRLACIALGESAMLAGSSPGSSTTKECTSGVRRARARRKDDATSTRQYRAAPLGLNIHPGLLHGLNL